MKRSISFLSLIIIFFFFSSCKENEGPDSIGLYFPPANSETWQTINPSTLGWDTSKLDELYQLLEDGNTRGFIVLKDGKIVLEQYFGTQLIGSQPFNQRSNWYWASAGKTLTATLVGIAQEESLLNLNDPSSDYLGKGWTSLSENQEQKISIWHQLTMTTGLDDSVENKDDFTPESLIYKAEPGTRWAYHNAPYTILDEVIASASGVTFNSYFEAKIATKIGMQGAWQRIGFNNVYFSNARSMARFGLMILAKGKWGTETILSDQEYLNQMTSTSQSINESYGYLWWLNGKSSFMIPSLQQKFTGPIFPNAPSDMVCGLGRDGQFVCIVPSQNLVLIRMGLDADESLVSFTFLDQIWGKLVPVIKN
ncbi:penicillin-binding protein, beta-lactamase class C [Belliella baltica DSM 15883]|uniref:Penicillin-binding protein, beta-lactamase class C n=1 Tax=Belliella baltica (strain DSM 15883 / CIP 108006 / LMG 21964 / BA134) TaxID=866536 RepID=I3Z6Y3_BELBD|nr:serine hydrolase domain-containing protein [Belliella baltica]AFL85001.1 penicillin-binding protein, beta-lactamase class C [Belliella baltica DSM 15883]